MSLKAYREAYEKADAFCKEVQAFVEEAGIPAINEMRYAGYHLLGALGDGGHIENVQELAKARNHAMRASYEAGEAGILCALDLISAFKTDYQNIEVAPVIPHYTQVLRDAQAAQQRVIAERDHGDDRDIDYAEFIATFQTLKGHCGTLDVAREELNKTVKRERREARRFIINALLAVAAVIAAAAGAVFAYMAIN